jgi:hypothetical protein
MPDITANITRLELGKDLVGTIQSRATFMARLFYLYHLAARTGAIHRQ